MTYTSRFTLLVLGILLALPAVSYAIPTSFLGFVNLFLSYVYVILPLLVAGSFVAFFWGVAKFILSAGDPKGRQEGRVFMGGGIIALFILVTFWALLQFASDEFQFGRVGIPLLPGGVESVDSTFTPGPIE